MSLISRVIKPWTFLALGFAAPVAFAHAQQGNLQSLASRARAGGKTSTVFTLVSNDPEEAATDVPKELKQDTFLTMRLVASQPIEAHTADWIYSVYSFSIIARLQIRPPTNTRACASFPQVSSDAIPTTLFKLPLVGGTAVIDGVTVTIATSDGVVPPLPPSQIFLFAGDLCSGSVLNPRTKYLLPLLPSDRISKVPTDLTPLSAALVAFGTVDRLSAELAKARAVQSAPRAREVVTK